MEQAPRYAGVDVAKAKVDVAVRPTGQKWSIAYDKRGVRDISQMKEVSPALVVLEASGVELPLVAALAAAELPVVVVNPRQVRDFARATGTLAKDRRFGRGGPGPLRRRRSAVGATSEGC